MLFIKKVLRNKAFYVLALITVLLAPDALYSQGQTFQTAIVTTVGIDKAEEGVEVSVVFVVPQVNGQLGPKLETTSEKAENVALAMEQISYNLGKSVGLAHCEAIVLNIELFNNDVAEYLDFFYRTNNLTINSTLIATSDKAKDIVGAITSEKNNLNLSLRNLTDFSDKNAYFSNINVDSFYLNYFNPYKLTIMNTIKVSDGSEGQGQSGEESSGGGSSGGSGEQQGGGSGGQQQKQIKSDAELIAVKKGKFIRKFEKDELDGLNMLSSGATDGLYTVKNFSNGEFNNVTMVLEIADKKVNFNCSFVNGVPVVNINLSVIFRLEQIATKDYTIKDMHGLSSYMSEELQNAIMNQVDESIANLITISKDNNIDILGITDNFYRYCHKDFMEYLKQIKSDEISDILEGVVITTNYKLKGKI